MKVTAQVICETNKVIIETPFEKFNMEYSDEMGKELFIALLLHNSFLMGVEAKGKVQEPYNIIKDILFNKLSMFIVDGKSTEIVEVSLSGDDIDESSVAILEKISTKKGRLYLVD